MENSNYFKKLITILFYSVIISCSNDYKNYLGKGWYFSKNNVAIFDRDLKINDSIAWIGKSKNGKAHGSGLLKKYRNKIMLYEYDGEMKHGVISGYGKKTLMNGTIYEGEFQHDLNGFGTIKYINNQIEKGYFIGDSYNRVILYEGTIKTTNDSTVYVSKKKKVNNFNALEKKITNYKDKLDYKLKKLKHPSLNKKFKIYYDLNFNVVDDLNEAEYYKIIQFTDKNTLINDRLNTFKINGELYAQTHYSFYDLNYPERSIKNGKEYFYNNGEINDSIIYFHGKKLFEFKLSELNYNAFSFLGHKSLYTSKKFYSEESLNLRSKKFYYDGDFLKYYELLEDDIIIPGNHYKYNNDGSGFKNYYENFNYNKKKWIKNDSIFKLNEDNNLVITTNKRILKTIKLSYFNYNNYSLKISFKKINGTNLNGTGIIFNFVDENNYDQFIFSSDKYFRLDRKIKGKNYAYKEWTKSNAIKTGEEINELTILIGEKKIFKINGVEVYSSDYFTVNSNYNNGNRFGVLLDTGKYIISDFMFSEYYSKLKVESMPDLTYLINPQLNLEELENQNEYNITEKESIDSEEKEKEFNRAGTKHIKRNWIGSGSGILLSNDGLIATNYHVIKNADYVEVDFTENNGDINSYYAKIVKTDPINDLALVKIYDSEFKNFNKIEYNFKIEQAKTASSVFALGYPYAFDNITREGLMGREVKFTDGKISSRTGLRGNPTYYQTTVPLQAGNSGGPLFDSNGNLIAINTSILDNSKFNDVSYSIKTNILKNMIDVYNEELDLPNYKKTGRKSLENQVEVLKKYVPLIKTAKN